MPLALLALGGGALGGFFVGRGAEGIGDIIKWTVIGGGAFLVARQTGMLK